MESAIDEITKTKLKKPEEVEDQRLVDLAGKFTTDMMASVVGNFKNFKDVVPDILVFQAAYNGLMNLPIHFLDTTIANKDPNVKLSLFQGMVDFLEDYMVQELGKKKDTVYIGGLTTEGLYLLEEVKGYPWVSKNRYESVVAVGGFGTVKKRIQELKEKKHEQSTKNV